MDVRTVLCSTQPLEYAEVEIIIESPTSKNAIKNVEASFVRNLPRFHKMPALGSATGPCAIVGGGPSLKAELDNLRAFKGTIIGCGTVHDYLVSNRVIPDIHVNAEPDADGVMLRWFTQPRYETTYLLASHCPSDIFDALADHDVRLWHLAVPDGPDAPDFRGEPSIPGGHFILGRAWPLAAIMGFTDIHFFGFDCSFPEDCPSQHAYEYDWTCEEPVAVNCGEKRFISTPGLLGQLSVFMKMLAQSPKHFKVTIHGAALAASVV